MTKLYFIIFIPALCLGDYNELELQTTHFAYERTFNSQSVIVTVNNSDNEVVMNLPCGNYEEYIGALSGERVSVNGGLVICSWKQYFG